MKKLMFAVAALTAGFAMADITSANIVGYAGNTLRENNSYVTPQFVSMAQTGEMDLQSIKCGEGCDEAVQIYVLSDIGIEEETYCWTEYGGENYDTAGWYDFLNGSPDVLVEGKTFIPGQGLCIQGQSDSQALTTSGQVNTSDVVFQLRENNSYTGNSSPVEIDLQDIICGEGCDEAVQIYVLSDIGIEEETYCWTEYGGENYDTAGWYDFLNGSPDVLVTDKKFAPGQGLCIQAQSDTQYITFPGVEL